MRFWLFIALLLPVTNSCLKPDQATSKSFVGLNAELDQSILRGEAPSFLYLQQWFNKDLPVNFSEAQSGDISYQVHKSFTDSSLNNLPGQYRMMLVDYLKQQQERISEFQGNLRNKSKLEQLLKIESEEMADILMALIEPNHTPKTHDLLARLIAHKPLRSFIDRYSVELLEKLYSRSQRSLVLGMNSERNNFAKILISTYLTGDGANSKFVAALEQNCFKLQQMLTALKANSGSTCKGSSSTMLTAATSVTSAASDMDGAPGQVLGIFGSLASSKSFAAAGASPQLRIFKGRDPGANDPYANGTTPSTPSQPNVTPAPNNIGSDDNNFTPDDNSNNGGNSNLLQALTSLLSGLFDDSDMSLAGDVNAAADFNLAPPPKPMGLCRGKSGLSLVVCQRYIETLQPLKSITSTQTSPGGFDLDNSGGVSTNASGYNFYMISKYATRVQNQGSEGACTAFGMAHTLGILGRIKGKSGEYDAWNIWRNQGQQPMVTASIAAARQMSFDGLRISNARSLNPSISTLKRQLDSGRPVYFASDVDNSWDGASRGNATLTCLGSRGIGHAYSIVGYDDSTQLFIVKNSWGDYWGDQGYGYMKYGCIGNMNDYAFDIQLQ